MAMNKNKWWLSLALSLLVSVPLSGQYRVPDPSETFQLPPAAKLDEHLKANGIMVEGLTPIMEDIDGATYITGWLVYPAELQGEAQPFIDAFDFDAVPSPYYIPTRDFFRRFTREETNRIRAAARNDDDIAYMREDLLAGPEVNLNDNLLIAGLESLKAVMIPSVWADETYADQRIAELRAVP